MARLTVSYFHRAPTRGHSLEEVFSVVRSHLPSGVKSIVHRSSHSGASPLQVILNGVEAGLRQTGDVNHITGDVHYLAWFLDGTRTVLTIPDVGVLRGASGLRRAALQAVWFDGPERRVAAVTTISESSRRDICTTLGWSAGRVEVIPVAVSPRFKYSGAPVQVIRPRVLQVGTGENKNLARVVDALSGLPVTLVVIGRLSAAQKERLIRSGLLFETHSDLPAEEMLAEYEKSSLVVFASTYEGFGMPIVEAQAVGRPVITSNCSSMPEVAGEGALFVDPLDVASIRNGIGSVLENPGLRRELVDAGLENTKRFSPSAVSARYLELYERLAHGDGR